MSSQVIQQAFKKLNPGGWLESQEFDIVLRCDDGTAPADHGMRLVSNSPTEGDAPFLEIFPCAIKCFQRTTQTSLRTVQEQQPHRTKSPCQRYRPKYN